MRDEPNLIFIESCQIMWCLCHILNVVERMNHFYEIILLKHWRFEEFFY